MKNLVDGTLSTVQRVQNVVDGTISTLGTLDYVTRVRNLVDGTLTTVTGVDRVRNVVDGTISTLGTLDYTTRVRNLVDGTLTTVTGVDRVRNVVDGTISTLGTLDYVTRVRNVVDGTISTLGTLDYVTRVRNLVDGTLTTVASVTNITNSIATHILSTNGTMAVNVGHITDTIAIMANNGTFAVYFSPAKPIVLADNQHTSSIFTVTGSTSGGTTSGVTLVAPSANYSFKVFAYSLQTTALASTVWRFTNGAGSETELWRALATEATTTSVAKGSNMAVPPPGFIFATGTSTTLALKSDTGSLVHYSISYIKESA